MAIDRNSTQIALATLLIMMASIFLNLWMSSIAVAEDGSPSLIEYRLEARPGVDGLSKAFRWLKYDLTRNLETQPFLTIVDFEKAKVIPEINNPGHFSIKLFHTKVGARKYRAMANKDRSRRFSILFDGRIIQSYAFPPEQEQKGIYDRGIPIYLEFSKDEATAIVSRIEEAIHDAGSPTH
jgi:hypothetical protein